VKRLGTLGFFVLLAGCAAQSSQKLYFEAKEKVEQARKINPQNPQTERAEIALDAGENYLREARYGKAEHSFINAINLADRAMKREKQVQAIISAEPEPLPHLTADEIAASKKPSAQETEAKIDRMSLPRDALAKYLADKRKGGASLEKPAPAKKQAPTPAPVPVPVPVPAEEKAAHETPVEKAEPAEEKIQPLPLPPPPPPPPPAREKTKAREQVEPMSLEPLKRVPRGRVPFEANSSKISDRSLSDLDGLAQFLIENPSNTLLIVPTLVANEPESLFNERFQQVADYLKARGVPEDQVRLDTIKKAGSSALLEMFLIDH